MIAQWTRISGFALAMCIGVACSSGPAGKSLYYNPCDGIDSVVYLNIRNIPRRFRGLIPLAARWGTGNREEREEMERHLTIAEIDQLRDALHGQREALAKWVSSTPSQGKGCREACAFKRMLRLYNDALDMRLRGTIR